MVDFVRNGILTDEGRQVVEHLETEITKVEGLLEGHNVQALNSMSGPYQDYYVNVLKMRIHDPAVWVKDRPYAVDAIWEQLTAEAKAERARLDAEKRDDDLATRLEKVEKALSEALGQITAKDKQIAALKEDDAPVTDDAEDKDDEDEDAPPAEDTKTSRRTKKAEVADPPADTAAEGEPTETD